jgi:ParB family chromosome partitioning protein
MNKPKTERLGRGLDAIFEIENINAPVKSKSNAFDQIELSKIFPNPNQPRTSFDEEALAELSDSISKLGVIQPITVKKNDDGTFMIISGERRFRASQLAGLETIPAYVREVDDQTLIEMALVENIQREDLNAIEIALSLQRLIDECNLKQETLAERVGKKRSTISNYLRLLKLPNEVQLAVREELISMGHARAIINVENYADQIAILKKTIKKQLSVRQVEELVKKLSDKKEGEKMADEEYPETYTRLVEYLEKFFNQDISIKKNTKGKGKIVIGFNSDEEIAEILKTFEKIKN